MKVTFNCPNCHCQSTSETKVDKKHGEDQIDFAYAIQHGATKEELDEVAIRFG